MGSALTERLLVVGDVVTDVVALYSERLRPSTDTAARIRTLPGGAGANAACWAAHEGAAEVELLARVGGEAADWHEGELLRAGVKPRLVRDPDAPTATVVCLVDAAAERTFLTDNGAALRLDTADWDPALLEGTTHIHLSGYLFFAEASRALALLVLRSAQDRDIPVSVDPASAGFLMELGPHRFLDAVDGAGVLLPNQDEAALLTGCADPAQATAALSQRVPLVVTTLGMRGALVAEGGTLTGRVAAPVARAVDSTGAGDAFTGGFLAARLEGASPLQAARAGCRTGALAVARPGGRPGH
ncbi:carbohydrate kinase family protein [Streptomyces sp. NPDC006879]|uniref:carbohydrate kinase family protein n=1 Tax=Streptomyces sp. NPDC006879 TaxID=3364767 RepID=UPI0036A44618